MAEKLIILSDFRGIKGGLWVTSYLGYLQQHYNMTFYDSQQLAGIETKFRTEEHIQKDFADGGVDVAVTQLLQKEKKSVNYLTFGIGGTIAWKAALRGLPMESLYAVSPVRLHMEDKRPEAPTTLLYGSLDDERPSTNWPRQVGVEMELFPNFGHALYSDEKVIAKVCMDLLESFTLLPAHQAKKTV